MNSAVALLAISCVAFVTCGRSQGEETKCIPDSAFPTCKCQISGGADDKLFIDLTPLQSVPLNHNHSDYMYSWSLCKPLNLQAGTTCVTAESAAACQYDVQTWRSTGRLSAFSIYYNVSAWFMHYGQGEPAKNKPRQTIAQLICNPNEEYDFRVTGEADLTYHFELTTKYACPAGAASSKKHRLSVGSIMTIIFFVLLVSYIAGGILYLRGMRGAEGKEMLPNYTFWAALPFYIKDGIVFLFSLCSKEKSGYETI